MVPIGAAFAVPIDDKRVGVCRVIGGDPEHPGALRVAATRWVGPRSQLKKALRDPRAREVMRLTHHGWRNKPCVAWAASPPPPELVAIGVIAPSPSEAKLASVPSFVWASLALQYRAQLAWEADPDAVRANDRKRAREQRAAEERARSDADQRAAEQNAQEGALAPAARTQVSKQPARAKTRKVTSLAALARRRPFADWREPLRTRARERIAKLITTLRERERSAAANLRAIASCARSFNREREMGTLEAEALDEALLAIACAIGVEPSAYASAIDSARDW